MQGPHGSCKPGRLDILWAATRGVPIQDRYEAPLFRWVQTEHSKRFVTGTLFLFPVKSRSRQLNRCGLWLPDRGGGLACPVCCR